jgi:hypothetical protein
MSSAEQLKFCLLAEGLTITDEVRRAVTSLSGNSSLTPADFASTSGVILCLDHSVWVNAPIADHNPNFVDRPGFVLHRDPAGLVVRGGAFECDASLWIPPRYHGTIDDRGVPRNNFVVTHGDRARVSPIQGCRLACKFCNVPYEDRYATKPLASILDSLRLALTDELQPARHVLVSGGAPRPEDHLYLRNVYTSIFEAFPDVDVDIMMVPIPGLLDVRELSALGVHELSINLELFGDDAARRLMPHKYRQGRSEYLRFIADAVEVLGVGRLRSMLTSLFHAVMAVRSRRVLAGVLCVGAVMVVDG